MSAPLPSPPPSLSPQRHKALRNQHPLYKRLSGESVWVFLEELGLDEAQCELFMDAFFRQMDHILYCMNALEGHPHLTGRIVSKATTCCPACAASTGLLLHPENDAAYVDRLPPFGIGCPLLLQIGEQRITPPPRQKPITAPTRSEKEHSVLCASLAADPSGGLQRYLEAVQGILEPGALSIEAKDSAVVAE